MERNIASSNPSIMKSEKSSETNLTYMATLRKSTGLSRLAWLTILWIKSGEIGSLRRVDRSSAKNSLGCRPNSLNIRIVGWRGKPGHIMSPFNAAESGINHAATLGLFNIEDVVNKEPR